LKKLGLAFALVALSLVLPSAFATTASIDVNGKTYSVNYEATGLTVDDLSADTNTATLSAFVTSTDVDGTLQISLDRAFFDSKTSTGDDDDFFVVLDGGTEGTFTEQKTDTTRTLTINVPSGTSSIDIIGTIFGSGEPSSTETPTTEPPAETPTEEQPQTPEETPTTQCGPGTVLKDGVCVLAESEPAPTEPPAETPTEEQPQTPEETPTTQCGPGTVLKDGACVLDETCGPGTIFKDGQCVLEEAAPTGSSSLAGQGTQFMIGIIGAFIIAFVIMIILWAIGKAGRKKN